MVFREHVDSRGTFQELYREALSGVRVKQISLCTINPGETRGGHYHKSTNEVFIVIDGEMTLERYIVIADVCLKQHRTLKKGDITINRPHHNHSVYSRNGCTFLILLDKEFDPDNPDTYDK